MTENNLKLVVFSYDATSESYKVNSYLERPIYVEYSRQYDALDSAKIVVETSEQNSQALQKNNLLWLEGDACMLIDTIKGYSENKIDAWGSLCDGFLKRRAIFEAITFDNEPISSVFSTLFSSITAIPGMSFSARNLPAGTTYTGTIQPGNFFDIIQDLCQRLEYGFKVEKIDGESPNDLLLQLVIYAGEDKSETVEMSKFYESISSFEYTDNSKEEVNYVQINGAENIVETLEISGLTEATKIEAVLDCTNVSKGEMTEEEYRAVLHEKGEAYLKEHCDRLSYSGAYTGYTFILGEDFNVGDIVTIKDEDCSLDVPKRVSGALKQIDTSGTTIQLTYGDIQLSLPALIDKIYQKTETPQTIVVQQSNGTSVKFITSSSEPELKPVDGDFLATMEGSVVTSLKRLENGAWNDVTYGYGGSVPSPVLDTYFCITSYTGEEYYIYGILSCPPPDAPAGTLSWGSVYPNKNKLYMDEVPTSPQADVGDYWVKTYARSSTESQNKEALETYLATKAGWRLQYKFNQVGRQGYGSSMYGEIFGDYRPATVEGTTVSGGNFTNAPYDIITGYENHHYFSGSTLQGSNAVGGEFNDLKNSCMVDCFGDHNAVTATRAFVRGNNNDVHGLKVSVIGGFNTVKSTGNKTYIGNNNYMDIGNYNEQAGVLIGSANRAEMLGNRWTGILPWVDLIVSCGYRFNKNINVDGAFKRLGVFLCCALTNYAFLVKTDGTIHALGAYSSDLGADYAEFFEWADGNPDGEDRRGMLVSLYDKDLEKITFATGDDFIGAISATPTITGDSGELEWQGKFKTDVFGAPITDSDGNYILSDDYDSSKEYKPRANRKEWAPVGLMGKIVIVDNGECKPGDFITAKNGEAIPCKHPTRAKMMKRIDSNHIRVLILHY